MTVTAFPPGQRQGGDSRDYVLAGDPDQSAEKLRRYAAAGVEHMVVNTVRGAPFEEMLETYEFVAKEIRPRMAAS
jgi:alkanesulfonate monooxygenase SsuD/methylene tetrahydromethanopterin reductase-like flavin-dependent oxidoreductase (luciferase family)